MDNPALNSTAGQHPGFASTQWGLLTAAAQGANPTSEEMVRAAWESLYRTYCYPVYAFIRRRGRPRPVAQDLTQDFFVHLMERSTLARADPEKGRFRTFLLGALEYFLADQSRRENARKRGGGSRFLFLDDPDVAEREYEIAAPAWATPERLFDARWAAAMLGTVFRRMREEMARAGKERLFDALKDHVVGAEDATLQEAADALGITLAALKSSLHRLRARYGTLLHEEVARTVANPADVEAELSYLRSALRAG